jgi:hypothetical protein
MHRLHRPANGDLRRQGLVGICLVIINDVFAGGDYLLSFSTATLNTLPFISLSRTV